MTKLGRKQAHETGKRIAQMIQGIEGDARSPCNVKVVRVSDLARAKETADIIASHMPQVERSDPDPMLNEGRYAIICCLCDAVPCMVVHSLIRLSPNRKTLSQHTLFQGDERKLP